MGYVNQHGLSRKVCRFSTAFPHQCSSLSFQHIFESIKHSLERLQLDYVDVLQCTPSPNFIGPILTILQAIALTMTHQSQRQWVFILFYSLILWCYTKLYVDCATSSVDASFARCGAGWLCPLYRNVFMLGLAMSVIFSERDQVADQTSYCSSCHAE